MVHHVRDETVVDVLAQLELRILAFRSRAAGGETEGVVVVGREQDERGIRNERGGVTFISKLLSNDRDSYSSSM